MLKNGGLHPVGFATMVGAEQVSATRQIAQSQRIRQRRFRDRLPALKGPQFQINTRDLGRDDHPYGIGFLDARVDRLARSPGRHAATAEQI